MTAALAGDVLALDEAGVWRTVLTAGGVRVDDRRAGGRGMSCDYVIYDEAFAFDGARLMAHIDSTMMRRPADRWSM